MVLQFYHTSTPFFPDSRKQVSLEAPIYWTIYLHINEVKTFTNVYTKSKYAVTLGYRQQTATDSANSRTSSVWDGTIHNCMIWNGRALNEAQIDNVYKRLLK